MKKEKTIIIIGSGIGGLATAARLASKGFQVSVFEKNSTFGGKLGELKTEKYRFDLGPSLFTYPQLLEQLFLDCGENISDYFKYKTLNESCKYFFEDKTCITSFTDLKKFSKEIERKTVDKSNSIEKKLAESKFIFNATKHIFLEKSLHKLKSYLNFKTLKSIFKLPFIGLFKTLNEKNKIDFNDSKTIQIFDRFATYNGSNPFEAPATLGVIPHLEMNMGTYFPLAGMRSIPEAVFELCKKLGVQFHFNENVTEILLKNKIAIGIETNGKKHFADNVVCNSDVFFTYKHLLPNLKHPNKLNEQKLSTSAIIFYWGIRQEFKNLGLHNIFFSKNYEEEFQYIFNKNAVYKDPTIYVNISSKEKANDAALNHSNFFVMINCHATNDDAEIEAMKTKYRAIVLGKLSNALNTNLEELIEFELIRSPKNLQEETGSFKGALYGMNSNSKISAFLRHPNFNRKIKNLYFCGGTVHPGGGIPLALLSAKITSELIQ